ncbi:calmodulin-binding protein [Blastopirellula marina]|uniref:Calmodulin-binding protein n=1 Tax=Blastopirellula marina TaxID=124 RepID=A0A2S8FCW9_9BACT|nr:calmodulin-binding protein [Blastopirellula marina]PTL42457.1 calmodulin-binding protein [Blastopirellula marina]
MFRHIVFGLVIAAMMSVSVSSVEAGDQAFSRVWGGTYGSYDWERFYHYPYVYYPQNFQGPEYYRSRDSLYYRYPAEMRIPVYNKQWQNPYPNGRLYHSGHHFLLDVF